MPRRRLVSHGSPADAAEGAAPSGSGEGSPVRHRSPCGPPPPIGGTPRPDASDGRPPSRTAPRHFGAALATELAHRRRAVLAAVAATSLGLAVIAGSRTSTSASPPEPPVAPPVRRAPAPGPTPEQRYAALATQAAATCPGLPPEVLYAISATETRHGRQTGVSSAGAVGPMQFLPATWRAYGADGDGDGRRDIENPADAVHGAARHLCVNGGAEPGGLRRAIWNYNHSDAYVRRVLRIAEAHAGRL